MEFVTQTNIHVGWEANLKPLPGLNTASRPTQPGSLTTISGMLYIAQPTAPLTTALEQKAEPT